MLKSKTPFLVTKHTNSFLCHVINNAQKRWNSTIPMTSDFLRERKMGRKFVDKTKFIESIIRRKFSKKLFFVRPRKFGKSLLVDQMRHVALGNREVFGPMENNSQQFHIYNCVDLFEQMKKRALLHLDLSNCNVQDPLDIVHQLKKNFKINNVDVPPDFYQFNYIDGMVRFTIEYLAEKSESGEIIILIDEYDSPITRALGDELKGEANIELAKKNRDFLRSFFTPFKPLTNLIHLLFITGVSKFSYTNLFSSMNDLTDISSMIEFHSMIG